MEGPGARTTGQESKANMPRRLPPATADTAVSYQVSLDLERVWEVFPMGSVEATVEGRPVQPKPELKVVLTAPRDRHRGALWLCLGYSLFLGGPSHLCSLEYHYALFKIQLNHHFPPKVLPKFPESALFLPFVLPKCFAHISIIDFHYTDDIHETTCLCTSPGHKLLKVRVYVVFLSLAPTQNPKYSGCLINVDGWMDG